MSKLEELIAELCPDGVEYKKVKEVYQRLKGTPITAGKMKEIDNPNGEIRIFAGGKTVINAMEEDIPKANITRVPAVLVQSRGVIDAVYYDKPFTFKNEMWAYTADNIIAVKYLYYVLKNNISHFREAALGMGSLPQISLRVTEDFVIPLPPLPIQREIVRILDNFTELTSELSAVLSAELSARRKQYEYYRDMLLTFGDDVPMVKLGDIADFKYGFTDTAKEHGTARFIRITDIGDNGKLLPNDCKYIDITTDSEKYLLEKGDLLMARTGATYGKTMLFNEDIPAVYASFLIKIRFIENTTLSAYYWHFSQSSLYWGQANKLVSKAGQPQFNANVLKTVTIPLPPLTEQARIVAILDRFDALCNDLTSGLPAEIEVRRKQYEYYRDKLLTFKVKEVSA
ncbi:MAG: restriction endonuclease subunit S [Desulfitobacteriaceae bacterium]|nr:restriction endonuclease subunit S [Desulfitobacteriaceae bacterium]MDD4401928.1 restriction endonuclease subunit S [Desulfitobacteriaceae bacterium]